MQSVHGGGESAVALDRVGARGDEAGESSSLIDRVVGRLAKVTGVCAGIFILGLMLLVAFDVIGRYALGRPIPSTFEISESAAVFMAFLAFAWSQRCHRHIRIEMAIKYFPPRLRALADIVALLFGLFIFFCIASMGLKSGLASWHAREYSTGILRFPLYPGKLAVSVGAVIACLQYLAELYRDIGRFIKTTQGRV